VSTVRRSLYYSLADTYFGIALQFGTTIVVSRLLTPNDIGVFVVAAGLATIASTFRDFGIAEYLIQATELTHQKIRTAFTVNLITSWLMGLVLFLSSYWLDDFYRSDGVGEVMRLQALNFVMIPFGALTMAWFRRALNYLPLMVIGMLANATSFGVAIYGAYHGLGYMSLAWSSIAGVAVTVGLSVLMRPAGLPWKPSFAEVRSVMDFGKHAMGIYFVGQIGRIAPDAMIGRAMDLTSVAYFSRGFGLIDLFHRMVVKAVYPICLPYFSQQLRDGHDVAEGYSKAVTLLTGLGWPFFFVIGCMAPSLIHVLYGAQWGEAAPLVPVLCLAAIVELSYALAGEVMIAQGRVDLSNRLQMMLQGTRILGLSLVWPLGLQGAAWGLVAASLVGAALAHGFVGRLMRVRWQALLATCRPSAIVAVCTGLPAAVWAYWRADLVEPNHYHLLLGGVAVAGMAWLSAIIATRHPIWQEIRQIWRGRRASP